MQAQPATSPAEAEALINATEHGLVAALGPSMKPRHTSNIAVRAPCTDEVIHTSSSVKS